MSYVNFIGCFTFLSIYISTLDLQRRSSFYYLFIYQITRLFFDSRIETYVTNFLNLIIITQRKRFMQKHLPSDRAITTSCMLLYFYNFDEYQRSSEKRGFSVCTPTRNTQGQCINECAIECRDQTLQNDKKMRAITFSLISLAVFSPWRIELWHLLRWLESISGKYILSVLFSPPPTSVLNFTLSDVGTEHSRFEIIDDFGNFAQKWFFRLAGKFRLSLFSIVS